MAAHRQPISALESDRFRKKRSVASGAHALRKRPRYTPRPVRSASAARSRRGGFSLVEAMIALSLTAIAGSVLLLAMETAMRTTTDSIDQSIAMGMASQLIDEVLGSRYVEYGVSPYQYPLGPGSDEILGSGRELYDDADDYHLFSAEGAEDIWGQPLGAGDDEGGLRNPSFQVRSDYFADWRQDIEVYYVSDSDPTVRLPDGNVSNHRAVEVRISKRQADGSLQTLAQLKRVMAYVPMP